MTVSRVGIWLCLAVCLAAAVDGTVTAIEGRWDVVLQNAMSAALMLMTVLALRWEIIATRALDTKDCCERQV